MLVGISRDGSAGTALASPHRDADQRRFLRYEVWFVLHRTSRDRNLHLTGAIRSPIPLVPQGIGEAARKGGILVMLRHCWRWFTSRRTEATSCEAMRTRVEDRRFTLP